MDDVNLDDARFALTHAFLRDPCDDLDDDPHYGMQPLRDDTASRWSLVGPSRSEDGTLKLATGDANADILQFTREYIAASQPTS